MDIQLTPNEARVIGCLMEKSVITPDQYPLSLNALVNACNQKSSREPVLSLEQNVVQRTVNDLIARQARDGPAVRRPRRQIPTALLQHALREIKFSPPEFAVVCLLLLRGPQTPGELKAHSGRLHEFADVRGRDDLDSLFTRSDGPFVARLPREPRRKDHAYAHLFGGPSRRCRSPPSRPSAQRRSARRPERVPPRADAGDAVAALEARVAHLEQALAQIKESLGID